jgi:hypothetical protein
MRFVQCAVTLGVWNGNESSLSNVLQYKETCLHKAADNGKSEVVEVLLEATAPVSAHQRAVCTSHETFEREAQKRHFKAVVECG